MTTPDLRDRVLATERRLGIPGIQTIVDLSGLVVDRAEGSVLRTHDGQRIIDLFMGVGSSVVGHSHPTVSRAVIAQVKRFSTGPMSTEVRAQYMEALAAHLPETHRNIQLYSTGSEAVDAAIRLVRSRQGRTDIMSFAGGFHGKTLGALTLHGGDRKRGWGPLLPGVFHAPYPLGPDSPAPATERPNYRDLLRAAARSSAQGDLAAVVIEPVQGTSGNVKPAPGFLEAVVKFARDEGALVVFDEVITGFGRTGTMFAFERLPAHLRPDVVVLGKAMASGMPASAIVAADHVVSDGRFLEPSTGSSTFGGNPVSMAAALATLRVIEEEDIVASSQQIAGPLAERLACWPQRLGAVRDVHCAGLMVGIGLNAGASGGWLERPHFERLFQSLLHDGVLAMAYSDRIRLYPSLNIPEALLHEAFDVLERNLKALDDR